MKPSEKKSPLRKNELLLWAKRRGLTLVRVAQILDEAGIPKISVSTVNKYNSGHAQPGRAKARAIRDVLKGWRASA